MTNIPEKPGVSFLDNPHAPDVYSDGYTGLFVAHGNMRITFETVRVSHISSPGPLNRVVIGRLVIPVESARLLATDILKMLDNQTPNPTAQGTPTVQ